jgi:hypothetical protein
MRVCNSCEYKLCISIAIPLSLPNVAQFPSFSAWDDTMSDYPYESFDFGVQSSQRWSLLRKRLIIAAFIACW